MEIKTCEEYVLRELLQTQNQNDMLKKLFDDTRANYEKLLVEYNNLKCIVDYIKVKSERNEEFIEGSFWFSGFSVSVKDAGGALLRELLYNENNRSE